MRHAIKDITAVWESVIISKRYPADYAIAVREGLEQAELLPERILQRSRAARLSRPGVYGRGERDHPCQGRALQPRPIDGILREFWGRRRVRGDCPHSP